MSEIAINVNITGVENVVAGMEQIGSQSERMAHRVSSSVNLAETSYHRLLGATAGIVLNTYQLIDTMERASRGQIDAAKTAVLLSTNLMHVGMAVLRLDAALKAKIATQAASIAMDIREKASLIAGAAAEGAGTAAAWMRVAAEKAKAIALSIAHALEGPSGWAILAGAAAAAAAGLMLATRVPEKRLAEGGIIVKPTIALIGEKGPEAVIPLERFPAGKNIIINIYEPKFTDKTVLEQTLRLIRKGVE